MYQAHHFFSLHISNQKGGGQFIPGKGIRKNDESLLALSNPAQLGKGKSTGT